MPTRHGLEQVCAAVRLGELLLTALTLAVACPCAAEAAEVSVPPGCKPPELVISREHPLIILYGPGTAELSVKCWRNLPGDLKPYCVLTMDPPALDLGDRLAGWRRMLKVVQAEQVPIVLQVCGDEPEWTTPVAMIETLLREFSCIKAIQIVEMRCAFYSDFAGELDLAIPPNLRYLAEVLELCGRYGKHLSLQIMSDMAHLASDRLADPFRALLRSYHAYFLPQNECIGPSYYLAQAATWGLWLAGYCDHWGMEPQWWWWTKGESCFIRPGVFGVEKELATAEATYARLYRAFIIEGALMGATVFSIEPPQDIWQGDGLEARHFERVIHPTLRQLIEQRLIPSREEVLAQTKAAYQLKECRTLREYDALLQDLDLEVAAGRLERAAYGALFPHLMKEMIPDTGGRYYFLPLLPVGAPAGLTQRFAKVIQPGECASAAAYRELLDRFYAPTENTPANAASNRACVLKCGRAVAVLQSRENLYEKQPFTVELPRWVSRLNAQREAGGVRLTWEADPEASAYRVWQHRPGASVYPEWDLVTTTAKESSCQLAGVATGTFGVTAVTAARRRLEGHVNYGEYLLFQADESPIVEQVTLDERGSRREPVVWSDDSLPATQEVWRVFDGVRPGHEAAAEAVLRAFREFMAAFEAPDLDKLMSFYDAGYRDSNGHSAEYARRAWQWWHQRTVVPYALAQVRRWDTSRVLEGVIRFTAWNRFRGTMVWDEPFGCHGRVRIPRHDDEQVTWTWRQDPLGQWKLAGTAPALPNFGEMLWNSRGHDLPHEMSEFADPPTPKRRSSPAPAP